MFIIVNHCYPTYLLLVLWHCKSCLLHIFASSWNLRSRSHMMYFLWIWMTGLPLTTSWMVGKKFQYLGRLFLSLQVSLTTMFIDTLLSDWNVINCAFVWLNHAPSMTRDGDGCRVWNISAVCICQQILILDLRKGLNIA